MKRFSHAEGGKCISLADDCFEHHFPGQPVYPGSMLIETMAQLGGSLMELSLQEDGEPTPRCVLSKAVGSPGRALFPDDERHAMNRVVITGAGAETYLDLIKNQALVGTDRENLQDLRDALYRLWSSDGMMPQRDGMLATIPATSRACSSTTFKHGSPHLALARIHHPRIRHGNQAQVSRCYTARPMWKAAANYLHHLASRGPRGWHPLLAVYYLTYACEFRCPYCSDGSAPPTMPCARPCCGVRTSIGCSRTFAAPATTWWSQEESPHVTRSSPSSCAPCPGIASTASCSPPSATESPPTSTTSHDRSAIWCSAWTPWTAPRATRGWNAGPDVTPKSWPTSRPRGVARAAPNEITISSVATPENLPDLYDVFRYAAERGFGHAVCPVLRGNQCHSACALASALGVNQPWSAFSEVTTGARAWLQRLFRIRPALPPARG